MNLRAPSPETNALPIRASKASASLRLGRLPTHHIRRIYFIVLSLIVILLSTLPHLRSLHAEPVIDDNMLIYDANGRGCGANPLDCFHGTTFGFYYRPLLSASFALGQKFHGPHLWPDSNTNVYWFHMENIILHAIVVALALCLFRLLFRRRITALVAGLLFGMHPLQVTITTFIGGRTDSIALFFVLLFAISLRKAGDLRSVYPRLKKAGILAASALWILLSLLAFLGAMFTKEQVFVLAALVPLLAAPHFRRRRALPRASSPFPFWSFLYVIPIVIYIVAMHRATTAVKVPRADWTLALHTEMVGRTLWYFTKALFFPTIATQHMSTLGAWDTPQYGIALLGYGSALLWIWILIRTWPDRPLRILMLWSTLTLISCINLIPIPSQFVSPYRAAIPLFGVAGIVAAGLTSFASSLKTEYNPFQHALQPIQLPLLLVALGWCLLVTWNDIPYWHDEFQLMIAEVSADPNFVPARAALALDYVKDPKNMNFQASEREYNICLEQLFGPASGDDYTTLLKSPRIARKLMSASSLRYEPGWILSTILRWRGWMLGTEGKYAQALPNLRAVLIWNPDDEQVRIQMRTCYLRTGQNDRADAVYRRQDQMGGGPP